MNRIKLLLCISIIALSLSCSDKNVVKLLPTNNLNSLDSSYTINTAKDEVAPITRPEFMPNYASPYTREQTSKPVDFKGIMSSSNMTKHDLKLQYADELAYNYLTKNVESVSFVSKDSGFVSFSHPPTDEYSDYSKLPLSGIKGGTDIFEFKFQSNGKNVDMRLQGLDSINSEFWDSQPFAADTLLKDKYGKTKKVTILLWSSDRENPYLKKIKLNKDTVKLGSTDIFYSFKDDDKEWSSPRKLEFGVSTKEFNEYSPFVYCICGETQTLFFSSDRDKKNQNDFDIYYTKIRINFDKKIIEQDGQVTAFAKADEEKGKGKKEDIRAEINSSADERFPYVPFPYSKENAKYLYFSSNRNSIAKTWVNDTVLVNEGGYDLYRFPLSQDLFGCEPRPIPPPPPPPKLYAKVRINEYDVTVNGDTLVRKLDINSNYNFTTIEKDSVEEKELSKKTNQTNVVYELALNRKYLAFRDSKSQSCDSMMCLPITFNTPSYIEQNDTITADINCYFLKKEPSFIESTYAKGIAMFVTGYWWPLTSDNLDSFKGKGTDGSLRASNFIDFDDYEFYGAVAKKNDEWFDGYFASIEDMLNKIDACYNQQQIVINVHGFTDPCRLRQTANNEYTKFSSDGDIVFNDVLVPAGTDMKNPELKTTSGQSWKLPISSQNGNAMLAMLRSYFTKVTIDKGIRKRLANNRELLSKYKKVVNFQMDFFGVYENDDCPSIMKNIVTMDYPNKPTNPETCNLPYSRRVMIYTDMVPSLPNSIKLKHERCGESYFETIQSVDKSDKPIITKDFKLNSAAKNLIAKESGNENIDKDKEALINWYAAKNNVPAKKLIADIKAGKKTNLNLAKVESATNKKNEAKEIEIPKKEIQIKFDDYGMGCPGPCYWIEFGAFDTEDEFTFAQSLIKSFGYQDVHRDPTIRKDGKIGLISGTKDNRPDVQNDLKEFESQIKNRLNKYIEVDKFKFKVMPLREGESESNLR